VLILYAALIASRMFGPIALAEWPTTEILFVAFGHTRLYAMTELWKFHNGAKELIFFVVSLRVCHTHRQ
jgi:hypothetical protein